jgi:ABC-type nitrate/sulfonate/bicarbonate transport system ATPase subunit
MRPSATLILITYKKKETIMLAKGCVVLDDEDEEDSKDSKHSAGMGPEATSV